MLLNRLYGYRNTVSGTVVSLLGSVGGGVNIVEIILLFPLLLSS